MTTINYLPCEQPCPKCGSTNVYRRFVESGHRVEWGLFWQVRTPKAVHYVEGTPIADVDMILNYCRCCQYGWETEPLSYMEYMELRRKPEERNDE